MADTVFPMNRIAPALVALGLTLHPAASAQVPEIARTPAPGRDVPIRPTDPVAVIEAGVAAIFDAPLVSISDVMKRKVEAGKRWRVRGVFAARTEPRKIILTGPDGAMQCDLLPPRGADQPGTIPGDAGPALEFKPGDVVEAVGAIVAGQAPHGLTACHARVIGHGAPPKPERMDLDTLRNLRNDDRWATVECSIGAWMQSGSTLTCAVADARANLGISVRNSPANHFPRDLHNALVRFTGISTSLARTGQGTPMIVPDPSFVEIIEPGREDPFDVPEHTAAEITHGRAPAGRRAKTRGTLVERQGGTLFLRGADGALCVRLQSPWNRPANAVGMNFADCGLVPDFAVGDELEIMGTVIRNSQDENFAPFDLVSTNVRASGERKRIEPVATTLKNVANGAHTNDAVELSGRLIAFHQIPTGQQWRSVFLLEANGAKLPAIFQGPQISGFETLKIDDEVVALGVVSRATPANPRQLWLASANDLRSLGTSPVVLRRRLWLWGLCGAVALALLAGWIAILRRSARLQRAAAATLEQRVDERTAELQRTQSDLNRALDHERELGELKTSFVSMVSHEFRTPLGVIMSSVELLQHYSARLPEEEKQGQLASIQNSTKYMGDLMEQVLVLSRAEAGKISFRPQPLHLASLAEKIVDETRSLTAGKCRLILETAGELSEARGDESLLRHILGNLIANAVKYSPAGGEVIFRISREGDSAVFAIADSGIGIPEKDRGRLFDAFHRGSNVGETPGTGLGLAIVKRCVDLHGGSIRFTSEVGKGTAFTVRLPLFANPA